MTEQEARTADALARLHPDLGALFRTCHALIERGLGPGDTFLLGVAARELTIGAVRALETVVDPVLWGDGALPEGEGHRGSLARALGLPVNDPMVSQWFAAHGAFSAACHWGKDTSAATLVEHFRTLSAILVSRLGPFFDTQDELERLAALANPTQQDASRLRPLLLLPVQREHFFERVESPGWLGHLEPMGAFERIPRTPPAERWEELARWASWPEGRYLERIAAARPDDVRRLLLGAPAESDNPLVWRRIAKAARALPPEPAAMVAAALRRKVHTFPAVNLAMDALPLATDLLRAGLPEGLNLLRAFLTLRRAQALEQSAGSEQSAWQREQGPFFERLPGFLIDDLVETVLPAAMAADPVRLARQLHGLTKEAIALATPDGEAPGTSKAWCRNLDGDERRREVRATLLRSLARALEHAVSTQPSDEVVQLIGRIAEEEHDAFTRLLWWLLARAGEKFPALLAAALSDERLLHEWWGSREAALLLRRQLAGAPLVQQLIVRHAFERGPSPAELASMLSWRGIDEPTEADVAREVAAWQRTRLQWFRGTVPPVLAPLAERLGVLGVIPSHEEQELAEDHSTSPRVGWVAPRAPSAAERWPEWSPSERLEYLRQWRPGERSDFTDERAGMVQLVRQSAAAEPAEAVELLTSRLVELPRGAIVAMMDGLRQAVEGGRVVPLTWIDAAVRRLGEPPSTEPGDDAWLFSAVEALRSSLQIIDTAGQRDGVAGADVPRIVAAIEAVADSPIVWTQSAVVLNLSGFARASMNGWNALGGELVQAVVAVGLALYRARAESDPPPSFAEHPFGQIYQARLVPILDRLLDAEDLCGLAARHQIGQYLPQLWLLDATWVRGRVVPHFAAGISDPDADPIWPAFVVWAPVYDDLYREWSVWYTQAARTMPVDAAESTDEAKPFARLVLHLTIAYLRGLVELSDDASGLVSVFRRAPAAVLSHLYWQLYRDFADAPEPPPEPILARLEALWTWRLTELEKTSDGADRVTEADGLAWFVASEHVSSARALQLGLRVVPLMGGDSSTLDLMWERWEAFAGEDPPATLRLVATMLRAHARTSLPHIPMDEARAACAALRPVVDGAEWQSFLELIADLARHGWGSVRSILP